MRILRPRATIRLVGVTEKADPGFAGLLMTRHPRLPMTRFALRTAVLLAALPMAASAQEVRITRGEPLVRAMITNVDRPMLGITTATESVRGDTLGLRIEDVREGSPAAQAGLKEGDRLQSINGISLRADRADAGEDEYEGVLMRRLVREMEKVKEGDEVELRVYADGRTRTVKVNPVKMMELYPSTMSAAVARQNNRAVVGFVIGSTGSARDTLGVFVSAVTADGPAEKAGIVEGDRIAAINGVNLRVAREDAEDPAVGNAKAERLRREIGELTAGDTVSLTVISAGRSRTVRVVTAKASEMPGGGTVQGFELRGLAPLMREEVERSMTTRPRVRVITPDGGEWAPAMAPTPPTPPTLPAAATYTVRGRVITI